MNTWLKFISVLLLVFGFSLPVYAVDNAQPIKTNSELQHALTVNINTADVQVLTQLKGIGDKKAADIIAWRETNGKFESVEQLLEVKGIGKSILEANKSKLTI